MHEKADVSVESFMLQLFEGYLSTSCTFYTFLQLKKTLKEGFVIDNAARNRLLCGTLIVKKWKKKQKERQFDLFFHPVERKREQMN